MATGSRAAALQRLIAVGYRTRVSDLNGSARCSNCFHVDAREPVKQHGLYCMLLKAGVKTHGRCNAHQTPYAARDALANCLDTMLRMISGYCADADAQPCTDEEMNAAMHVVAVLVYGPDARTWPLPLVHAVTGVYD